MVGRTFPTIGRNPNNGCATSPRSTLRGVHATMLRNATLVTEPSRRWEGTSNMNSMSLRHGGDKQREKCLFPQGSGGRLATSVLTEYEVGDGVAPAYSNVVIGIMRRLPPEQARMLVGLRSPGRPCARLPQTARCAKKYRLGPSSSTQTLPRSDDAKAASGG